MSTHSINTVEVAVVRSPEIFLTGAVRTPIGKFGGQLASLTAADLGVCAAREAIDRSGVPAQSIDQVIIGHARQAGNGPNLARQISVRSGVPPSVPAYTVNMACASGLQAVLLASQEVALGRAQVVLAAGSESMSRVPYLLDKIRWGTRMGHDRLVDAMYRDGFLCPLSQMVMGETAELLASEFGIDRQQQDLFALQSHQRAQQATTGGLFSAEIVPCVIEDRQGQRRVERDEHVRAGLTSAELSKLPPVFGENGTVTAGNACGITDGAAAVLVVSRAAVERYGARAAARVIDYAVSGVDPRRMGIGPVPAIRRILQVQGLALDAVDLFEINEAFAAQVLACLKELPIQSEKLNVGGGAIALGHPIGCSGARLLVTLVHALERGRMQLGIASLCASGGMGIAMLVERV